MLIVTSMDVRNTAFNGNDDEYNRLSDIPVLLSVVGKGYAKSSASGEQKYMLKLSTEPDEPDAAGCWIEVQENLMSGFVNDDQEFQVECSETKIGNISEIAEWVTSQTATKNWSLCLRVPRRKHQRTNNNGTLIFSFDNAHVATLFKMMHGI